MSNTLYKKRIKREVKAHVKTRVIQSILEQIPVIKEKLLTGFSAIEEIALDGKSLIDFVPFKTIFKERLDEFLFIPEDVDTFTLRVPNIDNFNFTGIEFINVICEGIVGELVEVTYPDMLKLYGGFDDLLPINTGFDSEPIYIIPVSEWLMDQEKFKLGRTLHRSPFSNIEPLIDVVFGPAELYVSENFSNWISQSVTYSLDDAIVVYGGKQ